MAEKKLPKMPYGQGSFKWADKNQTSMRYYMHYKSPIDGKSYRLSVYGQSAKECIDKMDARKKELNHELNQQRKHSLENRTVVLTDAMMDWLYSAKYSSVKARTYDRAEVTIKNQINGYPIGRMQAIEITPKDISDHLSFLQNNAKRSDGSVGYSFSTVKKTYELLGQFFSFFYAKDNNSNPMNLVQKPSAKKNIGEIVIGKEKMSRELADVVLNDDEIKRFKEKAFLPERSGVKGRSRYGVALYFIMMTLLRVGEAVSLTWSDIDLERKTLRISKTTGRIINRGDGGNKTRVVTTTPKTESGTRTVMLNDEAIEALMLMRERYGHTEPNDFVICTSAGTIVQEQNLYDAVKRILKAAGLDNEARDDVFGVHYLRHTGISYFLRHGAPVELVSKMAGHASVSITTDFYYHIIHDQNQALLDCMNTILNAKA